jgi:hypothetical protein
MARCHDASLPSVDPTPLPVPRPAQSPLRIAGHRAVQIDPLTRVPTRMKRRADHAPTRCVHAHQPNVRVAERVFHNAIFGQNQGRAGRAI